MMTCCWSGTNSMGETMDLLAGVWSILGSTGFSCAIKLFSLSHSFWTLLIPWEISEKTEPQVVKVLHVCASLSEAREISAYETASPYFLKNKKK